MDYVTPRQFRRRRIPPFHPVPVRPRGDGWTVNRQAQFIGMLAQTGSVLAAAEAVGMGRESAYRLRRRPGAAGFAAAWDAALGKPHKRVDLASTKATGLDPARRFASGLIQVIVYRGKFTACYRKEDTNALLQHDARLHRAGAGRVVVRAHLFKRATSVTRKATPLRPFPRCARCDRRVRRAVGIAGQGSGTSRRAVRLWAVKPPQKDRTS